MEENPIYFIFIFMKSEQEVIKLFLPFFFCSYECSINTGIILFEAEQCSDFPTLFPRF